MAAHSEPLKLAELKVFLNRGRRDYDWVASRIYAACYNDKNVLQKVLAAKPEDAPSSDEEYSTSEDEYADIDEEYDWDSDENGGEEDEEGDEPEPEPEPTGSEDDSATPGKDIEGQSKSRKRKRPMSGKKENTSKKSKHSEKKAVCMNCGSKFEPNNNRKGTCRYHPSGTILGELEDNPTNDAISDDEDSRETWPNAFLWECCETNFEDTDTEPCETAKHCADGDQTEYSRRKEKERKNAKYYG